MTVADDCVIHAEYRLEHLRDDRLNQIRLSTPIGYTKPGLICDPCRLEAMAKRRLYGLFLYYGNICRGKSHPSRSVQICAIGHVAYLNMASPRTPTSVFSGYEVPISIITDRYMRTTTSVRSRTYKIEAARHQCGRSHRVDLDSLWTDGKA